VTWLLGATALAAAVFGGAMFAFSAFVMPALRDLAPRDGVVAMQAVNVRAQQSLLLLPMGVLALGSLAVLVLAVVGDVGEPGLAVAGALLGLAGIVVTGAGNVPLNNRLASLDPGEPGAAGAWTAYLSAWMRWNHLRTGTSVAAAVLLGVVAARG
jgi:uncharacterized membrane protein